MLHQTSLVDSSRTISTIVLAFSAAPAVRWHYPEPDAFLRNFPRLGEHLGEIQPGEAPPIRSMLRRRAG